MKNKDIANKITEIGEKLRKRQEQKEADAIRSKLKKELVEIIKNNKPKDGYTPQKGIDYNDGEDGYTPVKGKDYFDGKDGYTPKKGKDYRDGVDGKTPEKGKD
jgi:hypothetical protein